jgi:hypothetical protein
MLLAETEKVEADAAAVVQGSAVALLPPPQAEITRLTRRVHELEERVVTLTAELDDAAPSRKSFGGQR